MGLYQAVKIFSQSSSVGLLGKATNVMVCVKKKHLTGLQFTDTLLSLQAANLP